MTDRQREVLRFITDHVNEFGEPPTLDQIKDAIGVSHRSTAHSHCTTLVKQGFLEPRSVAREILETRYFPVERLAA